MAFGNREKLITGVVAALGAGAALHFLVYAPRAAELEAARGEYNNTSSELQSMGQPQPQEAIDDFALQTARARLDTLEFLRDSGVALPKRIKDAEDPDADPAIRRDMQVEIQRHLDEITALRGQAGMPALAFLDAPTQQFPRRWDVLEAPPANMNLADVASALNERSQTLQQMSAANREAALGGYLAVLNQSGLVNVQMLLFLEDQHGPLLGTMTRLNRVNLLERNLQPEDISARTPEAFRRQLEQMFLLEWDDPEVVSTTTAARQLEVLQDLIAIAREAGVAEILEASFEEKVEVEDPPLVARDDMKDGKAPGSGGFGGFGDGFGGFPGGGFGGFPGGFPGDFGDFGGGFGGDFAGGFGMTTAPTVNEKKVADAAPVVITVGGTHGQVMDFLHRVTSVPGFYTVDGLTMLSYQADGQPRVAARANIYFPLSLAKPPLNMAAEELEEKLAEARRVVSELGG